MNLLRPSLLFWVCILALLGAATAGAQTQPLEASFEVAPAAPTANAPVTFTDTTKNPTGAKLEYAWDLDADDSFDDGTSRRPSRRRSRRASTASRCACGGSARRRRPTRSRRTITVGEALPPTETATATPTATADGHRHAAPPVIKAPSINLPPQAQARPPVRS